eukprot:jgi/Botrbrau1/19617/Bobra.0735s0001.1
MLISYDNFCPWAKIVVATAPSRGYMVWSPSSLLELDEHRPFLHSWAALASWPYPLCSSYIYFAPSSIPGLELHMFRPFLHAHDSCSCFMPHVSWPPTRKYRQWLRNSSTDGPTTPPTTISMHFCLVVTLAAAAATAESGCPPVTSRRRYAVPKLYAYINYVLRLYSDSTCLSCSRNIGTSSPH